MINVLMYCSQVKHQMKQIHQSIEIESVTVNSALFASCDIHQILLIVAKGRKGQLRSKSLNWYLFSKSNVNLSTLNLLPPVTPMPRVFIEAKPNTS